MNCQPGDAELDSIQHQQLGGSLMNTVVERFNLPRRCDEESLEEFRCDPKTSTDEKLSSNKDKEEPTLAFRPGPVDEDKKHTEDETEYVVSCEYCKKEFDNKLGVLECYTRHFKHDLKNVCKSLLDPEQHHQQCPFCSEKFEHFDSLTCHLGTVHLLVNDFLIQEGVRPLLPSNEDYETYLDSLENLG